MRVFIYKSSFTTNIFAPQYYNINEDPNPNMLSMLLRHPDWEEIV